MNAILVERALEKVPNRHVLVNLISRRVRQLNSGIGAERRPLLIDSDNRSMADTALLELIEGRMTFEMPQFTPLKRPTQAGNRPKGWARILPEQSSTASVMADSKPEGPDHGKSIGL